MLGNDLINHALRRINHHAQAQWPMHPALAVMQRLLRQTDAQIATVAFKHPDTATDNVVQNLVTAAKTQVIGGGGQVLQVDPVSSKRWLRASRRNQGRLLLCRIAISFCANRQVANQGDDHYQKQDAGVGGPQSQSALVR